MATSSTPAAASSVRSMSPLIRAFSRVGGSAGRPPNDEAVEQLLGRGGYLVDRRGEHLGVGGRRRTHPGDLADVLQGGRFDVSWTGLFRVRGAEGLDAS